MQISTMSRQGDLDLAALYWLANGTLVGPPLVLTVKRSTLPVIED